ncbi:MAG TPA: aldehyde dehydrogenase family protein [Steroidobacteraceae bacterium]|jgi:acyl-CoA reductase-like NAD-dependent aldehyde dehydrogenase|nr:aldehyde dehydrogenase family protein [Steroidobacteraceae bacterium]
MTDVLKAISPVDGRVYVERSLESAAGIERALDRAQRAQRAWRSVPLAVRCDTLQRAVDAFVANAGEIATEITWQMGRPIRHSPAEVRGFEERARCMLQLAPETLAAIQPGDKPGFERQIKRVPLGVVVVVAPWNYPYLTAVNAVLPALIAGNAVVLKHSHQTPLCAERFLEAFAKAGVPAGVFQYLHLSHADTSRLMSDPRVASVCFTGSVAGGRAVVAATATGFATAGLELGGKDPAYVRADANLAHAIESLTDGAFFNAGQSCCGIKRIYVAASRYEEFVDGVVELATQYQLGSPLDPQTTLGPVVRTAAADAVRAQVREALAHGASQLIDQAAFAASIPGTPYLAPQVLVDVDHTMAIMREETFGPAVGIMKVDSDEQALRLMNDSDYGLTAAIYSADAAHAEALGDALETGTVFLNRCDYLDPALAWTGVKNSGRGCTLSRVGFEQLTRAKSYHFRVTT